MSRNLKDKTVVVTGGADGIGFGIADHFLGKKAKVAIILDINEEKGVNAASTLNSRYGANKAVFMKCNIIKDLDIVFEKIINDYQTIDVLVNNAGLLRENSVKISVDVNVTALMEWTYKFWDHMRTDKEGKGGTIINISSIYGFRMMPTIPIYQATKFAVFGFSKSLGHDFNFKNSGVRVIAICPGLTNSNMTSAPVPRDKYMIEELNASVLTHKWQETDDLGRGAVEVFEKADSGTTWLIEGTEPAIEVTATYSA